jgi:hypothetical protein
MATMPKPLAGAVREEPEYVNIEVDLSGQDLRNIKRIIGNKFEPEATAWLVVKVKKKEQ